VLDSFRGGLRVIDKRNQKSKQEENGDNADRGENREDHNTNLPDGRAMNTVSSSLQFDWITSRLKHE
jgi:hypothetical protein